jgi:hypothetical protein
VEVLDSPSTPDTLLLIEMVNALYTFETPTSLHPKPSLFFSWWLIHIGTPMGFPSVI